MSNRFSRQSFLGAASQATIEGCIVGFVGLGGGGGHIAQQCAHVGFLNYVVFDGDIADESNLNRLVLADELSAIKGVSKVELAKSRILAVRSNASVDGYMYRWQEKPERLRCCDLVIGSVDTYVERQQLEACCRRYLIPYIDIGMDVHAVEGEAPTMAGQIILSMPGGPCMFCMGFLTQEKLGREAAQYGAAGGRPQVVWANGVLASTAVGVAVDLLTDWTNSTRGPVYLSYRGNDGTVQPHVRLKYLSSESCPHYPSDGVGDPEFVGL